MVSANDLLRLKQESDVQKTRLANLTGQIQQLKAGDKSDLREMKERLVKLETERVALEQQYDVKNKEYRRAYDGYFNPP